MSDDKYLIGIYPDGKFTKQELTDQPTLQQLQGIVGGYIEIVPGLTSYQGQSCIAFCNEEGKLHGAPYNPFAQALWVEAYGRTITTDLLVGPIAIVVGPQSFLSEL